MTNKTHTVEKIGGTSMSRFKEILDNVIIANRKPAEFYNRVFVVSAYAGITDMLLNYKKTGENGVFSYFANEDKTWEEALEKVREEMLRINSSLKPIGLNSEKADTFVNDRISGIKNCLKDIIRIRSYGHLSPENYLPPSREFLSAIGEAHSAFNTFLILKELGINSLFIDLSGWKEQKLRPLEEVIKHSFKSLNITTQLPIVTGYAKCLEGMINNYERGYSEITFSKIAVITGAKEGIIHKEFHLCSGDPNLIGINKVKIIGNTNFDIADQLSAMSMEAIHPSASRYMEMHNIPIRVKNAFDSSHPGTLICRSFTSKTPKIDMICGRNDTVALEVYDSSMVRESEYECNLLKIFSENRINFIGKNTNANTIVHYIAEKDLTTTNIVKNIQKSFPNASISIYPISIVSVIGSNMAFPGFLSKISQTLSDAAINILGVNQDPRQVNIQLILDRGSYKEAQLALHKKLLEED